MNLRLHLISGSPKRLRVRGLAAAAFAGALVAGCAPAARAPGPARAEGSGCVAPTKLPDGIWYGFATASGGKISFDLACFYYGEESHLAQAEDGVSGGDFYDRNQSTALRTLTPSGDFKCTVFKYLGVGAPEGQTHDFSETQTGSMSLLATRSAALGGRPMPIVVLVVKGVVKAAIELYIP